MNLQEAWSKLEEETLKAPPLKDADIAAAIRQASQAPLVGIYRGIQRRLYWTLASLVFVLVLIVHSWGSAERKVLVLAFSSIFILALGIGIWQLAVLRKSRLNMNQNLLDTLKQHVYIVEQAWWIDELVGLFLYPVSICLGYFYGLLWYGLSWTEIMQAGQLLFILLILVILTPPFFHLWTRRANQRSFGEYLQQLKKQMTDLEEGA
jgi:hypothetical protein